MLTEEQKKARLGKMTSSRLCAALGLHDRASPLDAYLAIIGEGEDIPETKAMQRGNLLEDAVLEYPTVFHGEPWRWDRAPFRAHPQHAWMADSADALYWRDGEAKIAAIGEGKTVAGTVADEYGVEGTDEVARPTLIQSHWHLMHWPEVDVCFVPVLVGGFRFEFRLYRVERDANFEGMLLEEAERFMTDYVEPRKLPPATASDADYLRRVWAVSTGGMIIPDTLEIAQLARQKAQASIEKLAAEKREEDAKARLVQILGEAEGVRAGWGKVSYKNERNEVRLDVQAMVRTLAAKKKLSDADLDAIVEKFTRRVPEIDWMRVATELGATKEDEREHTVTKYGPRVLRVTVDDLKPKKAAKAEDAA